MGTENFGIKYITKLDEWIKDNKTDTLYDVTQLELIEPVDLFFLKELELDEYSMKVECLEGISGKAWISKTRPISNWLCRILMGETYTENVGYIDGNKIIYEKEGLPLILEYGKEKLGWNKKDKDLNFILNLS